MEETSNNFIALSGQCDFCLILIFSAYGVAIDPLRPNYNINGPHFIFEDGTIRVNNNGHWTDDLSSLQVMLPDGSYHPFGEVIGTGSVVMPNNLVL